MASAVMTTVDDTLNVFLAQLCVPEDEQEAQKLVFLGLLMRAGLQITPVARVVALPAVSTAVSTTAGCAASWKLEPESVKANWREISTKLDPNPGKARANQYGAYVVFRGNSELVKQCTRADGTIARPSK